MTSPGRRPTRRAILKSAASLGVVAAFRASSWAAVVGANESIRLGVLGLRLRGPQLIDAFRQIPDVRVASLCDVDRQFFDVELKKFEPSEVTPKTEVDFRRVLDDDSIDAVVIATPDHWHAVMAVWACQADKDVYVEKPVSHNVSEGRAIVEAARKCNRIVQAGTQNRSDVGLKEAYRYLREGQLGKIQLARGFDRFHREGIGKVSGPQPIPATVDYNLFQGPAPLRPLMRQNLHYDWHFQWATGTGDTGNRGVHTVDHIRWLIGDDAPPTRVQSVGGRYGCDDDGETPNTMITWFDCQPVPILWEMKSLPRIEGQKEVPFFRNRRTTMILECEGGYVTGGRGGAQVFDWKDKRIKSFKGDGGKAHQANFIDCVRSRKQENLAAEILQGHISSAFCHLANVSYLVGHRRPARDIADAFQGNDTVAGAFARMVEYLQSHNIDVDTDRLIAGPALEFDSATERFTGSDSEWANMYLSRVYRPPFSLPKEV